MKRFPAVWLVVIVCAIGYAQTGSSRESRKQPLRLVQTISLRNVKGRLDHMDVDVKGKRLFVAGLENGTFEVVDLRKVTVFRENGRDLVSEGTLSIPHAHTVCVDPKTHLVDKQLTSELTF